MKKLRPSLKNLLRDERGAVLIMTTVYLPVIVGFFTMAVDMSYVLRTKNTLQVTADAAALAGIAVWINDPSFDKTLACPKAKEYATTNMAPAKYGNVLKQNNVADCSDVLVGMWTTTFISDASVACGLTCNAVQVTTRMSTANGNSLALAFAPMIGIPTFNIIATAVATYGNDPTAPPWNVSLVQDVSGSFTQEIGNARTADKALEFCMQTNSPTNSTLGLAPFAMTSSNYFAPLAATAANNATITAAIDGLIVGGSGMPNSGGTNIASGINTGVQQICPGTTCSSTNTTFKPALVIVTDGLPNQCGSQSCSSTVTPQGTAETAANAAKALGMEVYVIYYCNDGSNSCGSSTNQTTEYLAGQWLSTKIATQSTDPNKKYFFDSTNPGADFSKFMVQGICIPAHKIRLVQ